MGALTMQELNGLGQAEVIAALVGPLVQGGADIYRTVEESKAAKKELKARQQEALIAQTTERERLAALERQSALATAAAIRQSQASQAFWAQYMPYIFGGVGLLALSFVAVSAVKARKKKATATSGS